MDKVTLRFCVAEVTEHAGGDLSLRMQPDYAKGANADWAKFTPAGMIQLTLSKDAAIEFYKEALRNKSTVEITMSV
jgi:hypothetical protein